MSTTPYGLPPEVSQSKFDPAPIRALARTRSKLGLDQVFFKTKRFGASKEVSSRARVPMPAPCPFGALRGSGLLRSSCKVHSTCCDGFGGQCHKSRNSKACEASWTTTVLSLNLSSGERPGRCSEDVPSVCWSSWVARRHATLLAAVVR